MNILKKGVVGLAIIFSLESFFMFNTLFTIAHRKNQEATIAGLQEPTVVIADTNTTKLVVVYVTDSAGNTAEVTQKFIKILPIELGGFLKRNDLQMAGPPCAWYRGNQSPLIFDVGVPVNKMPATTEGRIKIKQLPAGKAVVAHYYGPYDQIAKGYTIAKAWIKDHHKTEIAPPYEVYLGDPGVEKDPYKVLTNIIFPVE